MNTTMKITRRVATKFCASILSVVAGAGCSSMDGDGIAERPRVEGWSQRRATGVTVDQAAEAARASLRQWFGRVTVSPSGTVLVQGGPAEYTQQGGGDRIRDSVGFNNRLRRTASVQIRPTENGCQIECVVERQRLDTADHRVLQENRGGSDIPNATPIERDAGLSREQQDAWTELPRDREMERTILTSIVNRLSGSTQTATPDPQANVR